MLDRLKSQPGLSRGKHTRNQDNTKVNIFAGTRRLGVEGLRGPGVLGYVRCSGPHFLVFFFKGFFQVFLRIQGDSFRFSLLVCGFLLGLP